MDKAEACKKRKWQEDHRMASAGWRKKAGGAEKSVRALELAKARIFECGRCGGLVEYTHAMKAWHKSARTQKLRNTDGCTEKGCNKRYRPKERREQQLAYARGIMDKSKILTRRPKTVNEDWTVIVAGAEAMRKARDIRARYGGAEEAR